ncbi:spexin prohormone 1-like [Scomber scombrus]|uniref:Spexin prohormone 1-like n=1 Tax=Scomber scombrus TaxID=13677 RepID=A0AAV1MUX3_SCOSC
MALMVMIFVVTLVSHCWSAPQRRNWTPQAILYLKGAQRHRSVLERNAREEGDILHLVTHSQNIDGPKISLASSCLQELLQRAVEEDEDNPGFYQDEQEQAEVYKLTPTATSDGIKPPSYA